MGDTNTLIDFGIGHIRKKTLDLANFGFAQGNYKVCKGYVDAFINTLDEDSVAGKMLKVEFNKAYANFSFLSNKLEQEIKKLGYLERQDYEEPAKNEIIFEHIHDRLAICWRISLKYKLFDEDETTK